MKKIFVNDLPRKGKGKSIDWEKSIGYKIPFLYHDIKNVIEICKYERENNKTYITINYKDKYCRLSTNNLLNGCIGNLFEKYSYKYKHEVGDIIEINSKKFQILEQIKIEDSNNIEKGYRYKCLSCGYEDIIKENNICNKKGCLACTNQIAIKGINDIWTTNPELANLLANSNDGYKYTENSGIKVNWKCPNCGNIIKNKPIYKMKKNFMCSMCSDKIPYPEKFLYNILEQLGVEFLPQITKTMFKWCNDYRYDFYVYEHSMIIETHGMQHYKDTTWKTLKEEQENDKLKKELALQNGIKNYIVIDCRKSEMEFIKNSVMSSNLPQLLNFKENDINWNKCHKFACNSRVKEACDLWNTGIKSTTQIGNMMKLNRNTISKYLKQGLKLNWCDYNPKKAHKKEVICLNNNKMFKSIKDAESFYNINNIFSCCNNKIKSAGKHPKTGEPLIWMYYKDYLKFNK